MKLLVLMGGKRLTDFENGYPLYLTEINNNLILQIIISHYTKINFNQTIFCIKKEDIESFNVDSIIQREIPESKIVRINGETAGAICTALLASQYIDNNEELLIVSIDDYIDYDINTIIAKFRNNNADVGIVSFNSVHPRYSFAKLDDNNNVCEVTEKKPISKNALASFYYFKQGCDFVNSAQNAIRKDNKIHNAFYISQAINEMILIQKKIYMQKIDNKNFHSFKTEIQLANYINDIKNEKESI